MASTMRVKLYRSDFLKTINYKAISRLIVTVCDKPTNNAVVMTFDLNWYKSIPGVSEKRMVKQIIYTFKMVTFSDMICSDIINTSFI